jgi:hypothetical protein
MSLATLLTQVVTIRHPAIAFSRTGDEVLAFQASPRETQSTAFIESVFSEEDEFLRDQTEARYRVYFNPWENIAAGDEILWGSHTLEVIGPPRRMHRPSGLHHLVVSAVEVVG